MQGTNYSGLSTQTKASPLKISKQTTATNNQTLMGEYEKELDRLREENN